MVPESPVLPAWRPNHEPASSRASTLCICFIRLPAIRASVALPFRTVVRTIQPTTPATDRRSSRKSAVRLGFVPLTDAAPLLVAREFGFFARHDCDVVLSRELGWASIRDKLVHGELDAAHAPCGLPFALRLGLGCVATDCVAPLILNLHGNAITLSTALRREGVVDGPSLAEFVRTRRHSRTLVFGVVSLHSTHAWLLHSWLTQAGLRPDEDVRTVVVPPAQLAPNLHAGNLDGFCVGEPWNTVAIAHGVGWCAAASCQFAPGHPEKVLAVRGDFARTEPERHSRLVAALLEACAFCANPANADVILQVLSRREHLGIPVSRLRPAWAGPFVAGCGAVLNVPDFLVFQQGDSNEPTAARAGWVAQHLLGPDARAQLSPVELGRIFRHDLFVAARFEIQSHAA